MLKKYIMGLMLLAGTNAFSMFDSIKEHQDISFDREYILGCSVGRVDTSIGIFKVEFEMMCGTDVSPICGMGAKPALALEFETKTANITNFAEFVKNFLEHVKAKYNLTITKACFGVPGNANANRDFIQAFHIKFPVDANQMYATTSLNKVFVVNDFEILGFGVEGVESTTVNKGQARYNAPKVIIGAGAGLGSSLMVWDSAKNRYMPLPLGFCFADAVIDATNKEEVELLNHFKGSTNDQVTWGYLMGMKGGIKKIYEFICNKQAVEPKQYAEQQDIFANRHADTQCRDAVNLYMKLYTRVIRNAGYILLPYGGLYIVNAHAENNPELFNAPEFFEEMKQTGNPVMTKIVEDVPLHVVTDPKIKIFGAAQYFLVYEDTFAK